MKIYWITWSYLLFILSSSAVPSQIHEKIKFQTHGINLLQTCEKNPMVLGIFFPGSKVEFSFPLEGNILLWSLHVLRDF